MKYYELKTLREEVSARKNEANAILETGVFYDDESKLINIKNEYDLFATIESALDQLAELRETISVYAESVIDATLILMGHEKLMRLNMDILKEEFPSVTVEDDLRQMSDMVTHMFELSNLMMEVANDESH